MATALLHCRDFGPTRGSMQTQLTETLCTPVARPHMVGLLREFFGPGIGTILLERARCLAAADEEEGLRLYLAFRGLAAYAAQDPGELAQFGEVVWDLLCGGARPREDLDRFSAGLGRLSEWRGSGCRTPNARQSSEDLRRIHFELGQQAWVRRYLSASRSLLGGATA